jgi:hypothetical protein
MLARGYSDAVGSHPSQILAFSEPWNLDSWTLEPNCC